MPSHEASVSIPGTVIAASSFEPGEGNPEHAVDGDPDTFWHSRWSRDEAQPPHFLVIDYSRVIDISGLVYTARADGDNGHVKDYEVYVSVDGQAWNSAVAKGRFARDATVETIRFAKPVAGRYVKFVALNEQSGRAFATIAELQPIMDEHSLAKAQR
jgi:beta-galactosidase